MIHTCAQGKAVAAAMISSGIKLKAFRADHVLPLFSLLLQQAIQQATRPSAASLLIPTPPMHDEHRKLKIILCDKLN